MPVEITILSGQLQGKRIELSGNAFEVGDRPTDAVCFDAAADPEVTGRRASLRVEDGGWRIRSTGDLPIIVNHTPIKGPHGLRSGDIVRMSENGPDFAFALINRLSANPDAIPDVTVPVVLSYASTAAAGSPDTELKTKREPLPFKILASGFVGVGAILCVVVLAITLSGSGSRDPDTRNRSMLTRPTLAAVPVLIAEEGKDFLWLPQTLDAEGIEPLAYILNGKRPEGLEFDGGTGEIRWTPNEHQAPDEYRFELEIIWWSDSQRERRSTAKIVCQTREINQAPAIVPVPLQTLDLLLGDSLNLIVSATDSDLPAQALTFELGPDAPSGMQIDASTGRVTWTPSQLDLNSLLVVPVTVTDDGEPVLSATSELRISVIESDPWVIAAEQVRKSLYLVGVQPSDSLAMLPLGTACAVNVNTLLTSATVVTGLQEGRQRDWKAVAIRSTDLNDIQSKLLQVTDLKVHVGSVKSDDVEGQLFFDLGLLKVSGRLQTSCRLASVDSLAELIARPQPLGCIGFEINGRPLPQFDLPTAELTRVELYSVIPLPAPEDADGGTQPLLQLSGELPSTPFGSPIISRDGSVVGIYATQALLPEDAEPQQIHYAPGVTLVSAWLAGEGQNHWIGLEAPETTQGSIEAK